MTKDTPVIVDCTPVEAHTGPGWGRLHVKREDLSSPPPGPPFSKARGVWAHLKARPEMIIGVLDTHHSQAGHAVARACSVLDKQCVNFWPCRKANTAHTPGDAQLAALRLGAHLWRLNAARSAILYHQAKKLLRPISVEHYHDYSTYMMPNALQLPESVRETARELVRTWHFSASPLPYVERVVVPASSATIAAGVARGLAEVGWKGELLVHLGYSRSHEAVMRHLSAFPDHLNLDTAPFSVRLVDEGYEYGDVARPGPDPMWPCNKFYDLKAFRWWAREGQDRPTLLWNIG